MRIRSRRSPSQRRGSKYPRLVIVTTLALGLAVSVVEPGLGRSPQRRSSKKATQKKSVTPPPVQTVPAKEALDQARAAATAEERITLLERFISSYRGDPLEAQGRESLMREYTLRGEQNLREGSPEKALKDFKAVFNLTPAKVSDRVFGQFIFPMPVAMNAFGYRTESATLMKSFEKRFENDVNRLVQIGFFYVQIEAPLEAARVLERAVKLAPTDHRAHNSLGTAFLINLRLDDAAAEFEKALELDPEDEYANLNLANLARATGDYRRAEEYYRKQIAIKSDDGDAHGGLSIALLGLGRDDEAGREAQTAAHFGGADYRFLTQLAYFYAARKKTALARALIERVVRIDPRYAWAHITKANVDALEGRYGDALATMISAQQLGSFPTLSFELVKAFMSLDGYDQAIEVLNRTFTINADGEYETMLAGAVKSRSPRLDSLLDRERQAALFLNEQVTTQTQYRMAESLGRIDYYMKQALAGRKKAEAAPRGGRQPDRARRGAPAGQLAEVTRPRRAQPGAPTELSAGRDAGLPGMDELIHSITAFTALDDGRQAFRMSWVAGRLAQAGLALDAAEQLAHLVIVAADSATEPEGSMRDAPLLDRAGRHGLLLGRAYDALGWSLFKRGDWSGAVDNLSKAIDSFPPSAERNGAVWRLAVATQGSGDERRALDLYIASFEPDSPTADVNRAQIEALYRKLNGSLAGLEERLKQR
jgi:tetratricopeptide (TPR) repeat protein